MKRCETDITFRRILIELTDLSNSPSLASFFNRNLTSPILILFYLNETNNPTSKSLDIQKGTVLEEINGEFRGIKLLRIQEILLKLVIIVNHE